MCGGLDGQTISDAHLGEEEARHGGIRFELVAQLSHIDAQIVAVPQMMGAPHLLQELPMRQDLARVLHQDGR
jgi:hypothetical protein